MGANCSKCTTLNTRFLKVISDFNLDATLEKITEIEKLFHYFGIQMIPVQVLLDKNGKEYFRHVGYFSFDELKNEFKNVYYEKPI